MIAFLDGPGAAPAAPGLASATAPATTAPTAAATQPLVKSAPASDDPQKLLNLAKNYLNAGNNNGARTRLKMIIEKFPADPAAEEARRLLQTLPPG